MMATTRPRSGFAIFVNFSFVWLVVVYQANSALCGGGALDSINAAADVNLAGKDTPVAKKRPEDSIPVIEIKGEGKPMTAAQIRQLEEITNGGPLDIKVEKTWVPVECARAARRLDFVTFHYKGFSETGKKFDQTYGRVPNGIRVQLGVGMMMPGLDKGLKGMCDTELRKIHIPHRLSRKRKSRVWKNIPNDEHWLTFNIEMMNVEEWTVERQFQFLDLNNDSYITQDDLLKWSETMRKEFGKTWSNEDIDNVIAAKYYIKYFDVNKDGKVDVHEFKKVFDRDMATMSSFAAKASAEVSKSGGKKHPTKTDGRKRDPGFAWILDFNNDGVVSMQEMDAADQVLEGEPAILPRFEKDEL